MEINRSRLGNIEYGQEMEKHLKEFFVGLRVVDVRYNYLCECFDIILNDGTELTYEG